MSFNWKWYLSDLEHVKKNGLKVFSCFSCGGGSTMGYKLAGYDVIGNVEIDPSIMKIYIKNCHPKYPFCMDIRDFLKLSDEQLPEELFHLDILDGSPRAAHFRCQENVKMLGEKKSVLQKGKNSKRWMIYSFTLFRLQKDYNLKL